MSWRLAAWRLIATPMFTIFSVLSLATGVAVTTAVYSVVDSLFLSDLGIAEPERVAFLVSPTGRGNFRPHSISDLDYADLRAAQTSWSSIAATAILQPAVAASTNAEIMSAEAVSGAYFSALGVGAGLGRTIGPADADAAARVVVISEELWRDRFASDRSAIGRSIRIAGQPFAIIGVAPRGFRGVLGGLRSTRLWVPLETEPLLGSAPPLSGTEARDRRRLLVFGRLKDTSTVAGAAAELGTLAARLDADYAPPQQRGRVGNRPWTARSADSLAEETGSIRRFGLVLVALVGLVLLVACTNVANLVLARGTARQGELAVRLAMGASRGRLIWEQCIESVILAAAGAVAAYVVFQGLVAFMTTDFTLGVGSAMRATLSIRPALDGQAVAVAAVALLLSLAVFGLEPALQLARAVDIRSALAAGATGIRPRVKRQRMVIRWQVAIAAGFFIVATMFIRATLRQARHDPGVEMDRFAVALLNFEGGRWDEGRIRRAIDRVIEEGRQEPAIERIAASTGLPFGIPPALPLSIATSADLEGLKRPAIAALGVTPALFQTLGIEIVRGRGFADTDTAAAAPVVVVSELTARQMFGTGDPVGQSLNIKRPDRASQLAAVIGVARDTDTMFLFSNRRPLVYVPLTQHFEPTITIAARGASGTAALQPLREVLRRADPDLAVDAVDTGRRLLAGPFQLLASAGRATLYLGGFTLLLSMVGLFGVQSHVVERRTREIGVRMSLGATARQIKLMVIKDGYRPVVEGLILGLWGGFATRVVIKSYMEIDVAIFDPWMLFLTPIPLIAAAFCACYLPASRAASVEPTVALRCE